MANKRNGKSYSDLDKAAVRTLISSGQMGIKEVVKQTGIARNTVRDWIRTDDDKNVAHLSDILTAGMMQELKGFTSLCIRELSNRLQDKDSATTKDVLAAMELGLNTMISMSAAAKPANEAKETSESEYWRGVVSRLLMKAQSAGQHVTYEDAVMKVITARPEAQPYLLATHAEETDTPS